MAKCVMGEKERLLEGLGEILFDELERLAPSSPMGLNDWSKIGKWERLLYVNCIERLLEERELIQRALQFTDDDLICGRSKEAK